MTAAAATDEIPELRLRLLAFAAINHGGLIGTAVVQIDPPGLLIHDWPIFRARNGHIFAGVPSAPICINGTVLLGEDGKPQRRTIVRWRDKAQANRFSAALVAVVKAKHPEIAGAAE